MQLLKQHILDDFPKSRSCLPGSIRIFFQYRECLSIVDGVIMKGPHFIIPVSLRNKTLETLHSSHMGITKTIEDLMHRCYSAGVRLRLALIEFLSTPGPDGKSPAELCGHQFKGISPVLNPKTSEHDSDLFSERKESEKKTFDVRSQQLPVLFVGSYVNY